MLLFLLDGNPKEVANAYLSVISKGMLVQTKIAPVGEARRCVNNKRKEMVSKNIKVRIKAC